MYCRPQLAQETVHMYEQVLLLSLLSIFLSFYLLLLLLLPFTAPPPVFASTLSLSFHKCMWMRQQ
jgi:hypothetical protein